MQQPHFFLHSVVPDALELSYLRCRLAVTTSNLVISTPFWVHFKAQKVPYFLKVLTPSYDSLDSDSSSGDSLDGVRGYMIPV